VFLPIIGKACQWPYPRPTAEAAGEGVAGGPFGEPKKRKKSDFGLSTMRVPPPFNPVS
jgi:hypothetical protein